MKKSKTKIKEGLNFISEVFIIVIAVLLFGILLFIL